MVAVNQSDLKIGHLVSFLIIKALPDYESYLANLPGREIFAQLPRKYSIKQYKIGDSDWAAIFNIIGARVTLSQRSPQYIRKIIEYVLSEPIKKRKLAIRHVAKVDSSNFYKVAVLYPDKEDISKLLAGYTGAIKEFIPEKITFIEYSDDTKQYIANALSPAPKDAIKSIVYLEDIKQADVYVDAAYIRQFMGRSGSNISTASKLTGTSIRLTPI